MILARRLNAGGLAVSSHSPEGDDRIVASKHLRGDESTSSFASVPGGQQITARGPGSFIQPSLRDLFDHDQGPPALKRRAIVMQSLRDEPGNCGIELGFQPAFSHLPV